MSEIENGKKDQLPPPEEEGAMQASVQDTEGVPNEEKVTSVPPWAGYGHFKTICDQPSKAEIAKEFQARNALVREHAQAQRNLDLYQKCHAAHQYRRMTRNRQYSRDQVVAEGSEGYSQSKALLEEVN